MKRLFNALESLGGEGFADKQGVSHPRNVRRGGTIALAVGLGITTAGFFEAASGHIDAGLLEVGLVSLQGGAGTFLVGAVMDAPYVPPVPPSEPPETPINH